MKKTMWLLFLLGGAIIFLSACGPQAPSPEEGQNLAVLKGCVSCHSVDDATKIAPPWRGLYGSTVQLNDGDTVTVDDAYLIESIKEPNQKIVAGYTRGAMPVVSLTEEEVASIVAYIKSVR